VSRPASGHTEEDVSALSPVIGAVVSRRGSARESGSSGSACLGGVHVSRASRLSWRRPPRPQRGGR
jgi:hypothetical protein